MSMFMSAKEKRRKEEKRKRRERRKERKIYVIKERKGRERGNKV